MIPYIRVLGLIVLLILLIILWSGNFTKKIKRTILPVIFIMISLGMLPFLSWLAEQLN
jgi:hypothetical protein